MADSLLLGPVSFQDFEIPERIGFGGRQRLAVHVLPGGTRVVDVLGADAADIGWSGAFSGADAADRARALDLLRAEGGVWTLTWDAFAYAVIIAEFSADYEHVNWVPYAISCTVVQDLSQPPLAAAAVLATDVLADLAAVSGIDVSGATAALAVSGAFAPGTAAYASAVGAVGQVVVQANAGMQSAGVALLAAPDPASAATAAGQLATYADANGYAGRALANLNNAGA